MDRSAQIALSGATAFVYDEKRDVLYVTAQSGVLHRWSAESGTFLSSVNLGGTLADVDIAADGSFLLVAQRTATGSGDQWSYQGQDTVHRISLVDLSVQNLTFAVSGYERGVFDVALTSTGAGIATTTFAGSGWTPLRMFDPGAAPLATGPVAGLRDVAAPASLIASETHRYVLVLEGNISSAPMHVYDSNAGRVIASSDFYRLGSSGFNTGRADISDAAGLVVNSTYNNTFVLDLNLALVKDLSALNRAGQVAGVQFSEDGRQLFVWEAGADDVLVFDTASWTQIAKLDVRTDVGTAFNGADWGAMTTADDGRLLFLKTQTGFEVLDLAERLALRLDGGAGADSLFGAVAADTLTGGAGDDLLGGGGGDDRLDGGTGVDTATFERTRRAGVEVNLAAGTATGADTGADVLLSIENARGSEFADTLLGSDGDNRLEGRSGADMLNGAGGNDVLDGGAGTDRLFGAAGDDVLIGGSGDDELNGGAGDDRVVLGSPADADVIVLGAGVDVLRFTADPANAVSATNPGRIRVSDFQAGAGGDRIELGAYVQAAPGTNPFAAGTVQVLQSGADTLLQFNAGQGFVTLLTLADTNRAALTSENFGGFDPGRLVIGTSADDSLSGGDGPDVIEGLEGADVITGGGGGDRLFGGAGDDGVFAQAGNDAIEGGTGRDRLFGEAGDDLIRGQDDDDLAEGGIGNDRLYGEAGDDLIGGQDGDDLIEGGIGNDQLYGDGGDDVIGGQDGNDTLVGGGGRDRLFGGAGDDAIGGQEDGDLIEGGLGTDRLYGEGGDDLVGGQDGDDLIEGNAGADRLFGDTGDDTILAGDGADFVNGGLGRDRLFGGEGGDTLQGADGDDRLFGEGGNDAIGAGDGADFVNGGVGFDLIFGEGGNDQLEGGGDGDRIFGDAGDDAIGGQDGNDFINGGSGRDLLFGELGNDHIEGGSEDDALFGDAGDDLMGGQDGNDLLVGGLGRDTLFGDAGDDILFGEAGDDRLDGGAGLDTAVFRGARSDYTITTSDGVTTVVGADGADTLVGFERLRFDDGVVTAATAVGGFDDATPVWIEPASAAPVVPDWLA